MSARCRRGVDARSAARAHALADLAATLRARRALLPVAVAGVALLAGGSVVLGAWLKGTLER